MPRGWVYVELNGKSYVRGPHFKLTNGGQLFDMVEAPYREILVPKESVDQVANAARQHLQQILDRHPAAPGMDIVPPKKPARNRGKPGT